MRFAFSPYIILLGLSAIISGWVTFFAWRRRQRGEGAVYIAVLSLAITDWMIGYALEIAGVGLETKKFWAQVEYIGISAIPYMWLIFALTHSKKDRAVGLSVRMILLLIPLATIVLVFTNDSHLLMWTTTEILVDKGFSALKVTYGVWFWIYWLYSNALLIAGTVLIVQSIGKKQGIYRGQVVALLVAVIAPWIGNLLYITRLSPIPHLDPTPFAFVITVVALTWAIIGFQLVDVAPFAREYIVDHLSDGIIVFDVNHVVTDINLQAQRMLNHPPDWAIGRAVSEIFAFRPEIVAKFFQSEEYLGEVEPQGTRAGWLDLRLALMKDSRQTVVGRAVTIRDISERKRTEQRLIQLNRAVEASPVSIVITNSAGDIEYVNPKFCQSTGYTAEEVLGRNPRILKTELTPANVYPVLWQTVLAGQEWRGDFCNRKKNGAYFWERASISPITDSTGVISHFIAVKEDITQERLLQEQLSQHNRYLSILHDITLNLLNRHSLEDLLQAITDQAASLLDIPFVEILLKEGNYLVLRSSTNNHPIKIGSKLSRAEASLSWQVYDTGNWVVIDDYARSGNMHPAYAVVGIHSVAVFPVKVGQMCIATLALGRTNPDLRFTAEEIRTVELFSRLAALVLDNASLYKSALEEIAERKRSQLLLQQSENRYRQIVENASDIIYRVDNYGCFTYVNAPLLHLLGYPYRDALIGLNFLEMAAPSHREALQQQFHQQINDHLLNAYTEFPAVSADGRTVWLGQNTQLIIEENNVIGLQALARDITERKQAEESMALARDQALEASQLKSQLLAKVTHELRTPLGAILGFSELMRYETFGPMTDKQNEAADQIIESVQFLNQLVNELLDEAQLSAQKTVLRMEKFNIAAFFQRIEANMAVLAGRKDLEFKLSFPPNMPETMVADEGRLQQILVNLVGNAIKFTKTGGVTLTVERPDFNHFVVKVADTGVGIPPESLHIIFDPFRQIDNSLQYENRGTGLGLTITKQLIELMGGKIVVDSEVGKGSVFTVILPLIEDLERPRGKTMRFNR